MDKLIEQLKADHETLRELFTEVYNFVDSDKKKLEFVNKFKDIVFKHIETEDKFLYPFLNKESETDTTLKTKLNFFAKDWETTSKIAVFYIEKNSVGKFDENFVGDTAKLISTLRQRMMKEEISLYSEYERRK